MSYTALLFMQSHYVSTFRCSVYGMKLALISKSCLSIETSQTPESRSSYMTTDESYKRETEYGGIVPDCFSLQSSLSYYWSWNHVMHKRWNYTAFQDCMLADFKAYMSAEDSRLIQALHQFTADLQRSSIPPPPS